MINYCTQVEILESPFKIQYRDRTLFMGSCFADHIGNRMSAYRFQADVNPFGVLYNPLSVSAACKRMLNPELFIEDDLFLYEGLYHSFAHHGRFSDRCAESCLSGINKSLSEASERLRRTSYLVITFGTAYVYRLKKNGMVVANCHKLPASDFVRERLTVSDIIDEWSALLEDLWRVNPSLKIICTVSPIRHWKDGAHLNQISKATLLLAEQALTGQYSGRVVYFPAYEIMMDELRDYRFYMEDMIHPSSQAMDYIWERFGDTYMDRETRSLIKEVDRINRNLKHKPLNTENESYKQFLMQTLLKIRQLQSKNPYICLSKEEEEVEKQLKNF
jgi:hypothetical protein